MPIEKSWIQLQGHEIGLWIGSFEFPGRGHIETEPGVIIRLAKQRYRTPTGPSGTLYTRMNERRPNTTILTVGENKNRRKRKRPFRRLKSGKQYVAD